MRRIEKAEKIGELLDYLYPEQPIPLDHKDEYTLLVAVMLSAQTTDKKVNQVTPKLFQIADNPVKMQALEVAVIQDIIREVGLAPTKANFLESLAGVGHKTAGVVMSQAFGLPAFPVDTHIHRLANRWGLSKGKSVKQTEQDLKKLFPKDTWSRRHLQIIFFGREHCPALRHDLSNCLICSWAASKKQIILESRK